MHKKLFEKFKYYDFIALIIMLVCIFMSIKFLVRAALSKTVSVDVTTIPKISYKVHLKNNDYYETKELDQGMKYVASLIDYIDADINYSIKSSSLMDYDYSYYVDATARVYGDNAKLSVLYEKSKRLIEEKKITANGSDNVLIHENINIDYEEFNKLISSFKTSYNISSLSDVSVVLHVNAKAKANGMDKEAIINDSNTKLVIPLTEQTVNVEITNASKSNTFEAENVTDSALKDLIIAVIFIGISILLLFRILSLIDIVDKSSFGEYKRKLNKILKEYDLIIANAENLVDEKKYKVINISSFEELKDVHDNLGTPILFCEDTKLHNSIFMLIDNDILYKYVLKEHKASSTRKKASTLKTNK